MYHKLLKHYLLLTTFIAATTAIAQTQDFQTKANNENSPYSRFGIGEFRNGISPLMKGMGSISSAYSSPYSVNADNPASYASLLLTTYEGSLVGNSRTIQSGNDKFRSGMATINHISIGIPVGKNAGMSLGYTPVTNIYYRLSDTAVIPGYGKSVRTFAGDGSLNYAFLGLAGKYKGFSLGANFGYMFGSTVYASLIESIDTVNVNDARFSKVLRTGGIYWKAGAQYETRLKKSMYLRSGVTMAMNQGINTSMDEYWVSYNFSGGDTSFSSLGQEGKLTMPLMYSAGIHLLDSNKWMVGLDFSGMSWSNYSGFGRTDSVGDMSYRMALGGEYTPDAGSIRKYFNRVTYRLGVYYGQDYVYLRNTPINYYAVTFGFSLPFKRSFDRIHTAFEIGQRGNETNGLLKESFFRCTVGISLNDKWFIKRRYD